MTTFRRQPRWRIQFSEYSNALSEVQTKKTKKIIFYKFFSLFLITIMLWKVIVSTTNKNVDTGVVHRNVCAFTRYIIYLYYLTAVLKGLFARFFFLFSILAYSFSPRCSKDRNGKCHGDGLVILRFTRVVSTVAATGLWNNNNTSGGASNPPQFPTRENRTLRRRRRSDERTTRSPPRVRYTRRRGSRRPRTVQDNSLRGVRSSQVSSAWRAMCARVCF